MEDEKKNGIIWDIGKIGLPTSESIPVGIANFAIPVDPEPTLLIMIMEDCMVDEAFIDRFYIQAKRFSKLEPAEIILLRDMPSIHDKKMINKLSSLAKDGKNKNDHQIKKIKLYSEAINADEITVALSNKNFAFMFKGSYGTEVQNVSELIDTYETYIRNLKPIPAVIVFIDDDTGLVKDSYHIKPDRSFYKVFISDTHY